MTEYSTEEYHGYEINIYYDESPENPRDWDNVATFVCEHRRHTMGDEHDVESVANELFDKYVSSADVIKYFKEHRNNVRPVKNEDGEFYTYDVKRYDGSTYTEYIAVSGDDNMAQEMADDFGVGEKLRLIEQSGKVVIQTISMYEHSGCSVWLGGTAGHPDAQWDCGTLGFAYVEYETAEKEGATVPGPNGKYNGYDDWKAWANAIMQGEMKVYNDYVSGEVYGYNIENGDDDFEDSCWGFYGDEGRKQILEDCKAIIDSHIEGVAKKREFDIKLLAVHLDGMIGRMFAEYKFIYRVGTDMFGQGILQKAPIVKGVVKDFGDTKMADLSSEMLGKIVATIQV